MTTFLLVITIVFLFYVLKYKKQNIKQENTAPPKETYDAAHSPYQSTVIKTFDTGKTETIELDTTEAVVYHHAPFYQPVVLNWILGDKNHINSMMNHWISNDEQAKNFEEGLWYESLRKYCLDYHEKTGKDTIEVYVQSIINNDIILKILDRQMHAPTFYTLASGTKVEPFQKNTFNKKTLIETPEGENIILEGNLNKYFVNVTLPDFSSETFVLNMDEDIKL